MPQGGGDSEHQTLVRGAVRVPASAPAAGLERVGEAACGSRSCAPDVPSDLPASARPDDLRRAATQEPRTADIADEQEGPAAPAGSAGDADQSARPAHAAGETLSMGWHADAAADSLEPAAGGASPSARRAAGADVANGTAANVGARQPHETPAVDLPGPWLTARERAEAGSAQRQQQMRPDQEASPPSSRLPRLRDPRSAASPTPAHGGTAALASPASIDSRNRDGTHAGGQAASDDTCERPFGETTALAEPACQPFPSHVPQLVAATAVPAGHHDALNLEVPAPPAHQAQSVLQLAGVNALRSEFLAACAEAGGEPQPLSSRPAQACSSRCCWEEAAFSRAASNPGNSAATDVEQQWCWGRGGCCRCAGGCRCAASAECGASSAAWADHTRCGACGALIQCAEVMLVRDNQMGQREASCEGNGSHI
jgi:hypothetical protein